MNRAVVGCALLVACAGANDPAPVVLAGDFTVSEAADSIPLPFGRVVRVPGALLELTAVKDTRCPVGQKCLAAGDAVVDILVHPPCLLEGCKSPSSMLQLHAAGEPRQGDAGGLRLRLLALLPVRRDEQPIAPSRYVAWIRAVPAS